MRYFDVKIGDNTYNFSTFILGTHHFGLERIGKYSDADTSYAILAQYLEGGGNAIDTARCYGRSEEYIGDFFAKEPSVRKNITLITKGGQGEKMIDGQLYAIGNFEEKNLRSNLMQSFEKLRTDYIDIYFLHKDNPEHPVEDVIETLESFKKQGYIREYGASNWKTSRILEANEYAKSKGYTGFAVSEIAFSPYVGTTCGWGEREACLEMTREEYDAYVKSNIPVLAYNSQAYGFFYKNFSKDDEQIAATKENIEKLKIFREICQKRGITPQMALFGFYHGLDITALPVATSTSASNLADMIAGCDVVLDKTDALRLLF